MWTHDGVWHRLDTGRYTIAVRESDPPDFSLAADVEVRCADRRWSATFLTPEHIRDCLDSWAATGEASPGNHFEVPDAVVVAELNFDSIAIVVAEHFEPTSGIAMMRAPFASLDEPED